MYSVNNMDIKMELQNPYGILLHEKDIKLQRRYFEEMASLVGMKVLYRAPRPDKTWTNYSEIDCNFYAPQVLSCIFNEYPEQKTMKKLGWVSELDENASIISVPYDTENIQIGSLFIVPSAVNPKIGRLFRVSRLSTIMIYPASVTCELVPEYEDSTSREIVKNHTNNSLKLLNREEEFDRE